MDNELKRKLWGTVLVKMDGARLEMQRRRKRTRQRQIFAALIYLALVSIIWGLIYAIL